MFPSRTAILSGFSKIFSEKSISFDGTDERIVRLGSCPTGDFTISAWIYNTSGTESDEFDAIYSAATEVWFGMSTEASSFMKLHVGDADGSSNHVQTEAGTITKNAWHHVACTYNDSTKAAVLYIDGASSSLDSSETVGTLNTPLLTSVELGVYSTNHTYNHWNGFMDDIAVFDAVLTALQIKNIYNGGLPSDLRGSTNLISYWLMGDGDTFDIIKDVNAHTQKSLDFDGDAYISIADDSAFDITDNLTVSCWLLMDDNSASDHVINKYDTASNKREWAIIRNGSPDGIAFSMGKADGTFSGSKKTSHGNTVGDWVHVCVTFTGGTIVIYIDSVSKSLSTQGSIPTSINNDDAPLVFGTDSTASGYFFNGKIADVAIWNAVLDSDDVLSIYNRGVPNNLLLAASYNTDRTSNLKGYWRMASDATFGGTNWTIPDTSGEGNNGTSANMDGTSQKSDAPNFGEMDNHTAGDIQGETPK